MRARRPSDLAYLSHDECGYRAVAYYSTISSTCECPKCRLLQQLPFSNTDEHSGNTSLSVTVLPNPFTCHMSSCILLKPTVGIFETFKAGDDLHIGIANSSGVVFSYWSNGITVEKARWNSAVVVYALNTETTDMLLQLFIQENRNKFDAQHYNSNTWNCFDFVSNFCKYAVPEFANAPKNKITVDYVQPTLQRVMRYWLLLERVETSRGVYVLPSGQSGLEIGQDASECSVVVPKPC